jgi:phage shock protein A
MPRMKSKNGATAQSNGDIEIEVNTDFERKLAESIVERIELLTEQIVDLGTVRQELESEKAKLTETLKALGNA